MEKYIIKEQVLAPYKKYNAILEARINTSQYVKDNKDQPIVFNNKTTAMSMLRHVYNALINTTYTRRNRRTPLNIGYKIVYITEGMDYTTNIDGSIDAIEVRGILNEKMILRYSIESVTD